MRVRWPRPNYSANTTRPPTLFFLNRSVFSILKEVDVLFVIVFQDAASYSLVNLSQKASGVYLSSHQRSRRELKKTFRRYRRNRRCSKVWKNLFTEELYKSTAVLSCSKKPSWENLREQLVLIPAKVHTDISAALLGSRST